MNPSIKQTNNWIVLWLLKCGFKRTVAAFFIYSFVQEWKSESFTLEATEWWIHTSVTRIKCCSKTHASAAFALVLYLRVFLVIRERNASVCHLKLLIICPQRLFHNKLHWRISRFNYSLPFRSGLSLAVLLDFILPNNNNPLTFCHTRMFLSPLTEKRRSKKSFCQSDLLIQSATWQEMQPLDWFPWHFHVSEQKRHKFNLMLAAWVSWLWSSHFHGQLKIFMLFLLHRR